MTHFIAVGARTPSAAEASHLRRLLREIDPDLELVVDGTHGAAACWVEGPENYGASHMREKREAAFEAFHSIMRQR